MTFKSGGTYKSEWVDGIPEGKGVYKDLDGTELIQRYENGLKIE